MKLKTAFLGGLLALFGASHASAQTDALVGGTTYKVYDVTGATAFRSGMNLALQTMLGGAGTTKVGYVGTVNSFNGADFTIFSGTFNGQPAIVRCSQSGSAEGIRDVAGDIAITYIAINEDVLASMVTVPSSTAGKLSNTTTIPATANLNSNPSAVLAASVVPKFAFSDVTQSITPNPTPALTGGTPVGVICFAFMANASSTGITNMTDQTLEQLYTKGKVQKSVFTGVPTDTQSVLAIGRNSLSGTRILVLAETKFGPFKPCRQFGGVTGTNAITAGEPSATVTSLTEIDSTLGQGFSSGSTLRSYMDATSTNVTVDGVAAQDVALVSYAGIPDVDNVALIAGGTANVNKTAKALTYNGVEYSYDNVRTGRYTLWSFERLYGPKTPTTAENLFRTSLASGINTTLPTTAPAVTGIRLTDLLVDRPGGDGEVVTVP
jgi:hypothetical protein